jgi:hypothetical protein
MLPGVLFIVGVILCLLVDSRGTVLADTVQSYIRQQLVMLLPCKLQTYVMLSVLASLAAMFNRHLESVVQRQTFALYATG